MSWFGGRRRSSDAYLESLIDAIRNDGWQVMDVQDADPEIHYTVGLSSVSLDELIVFGCDEALGVSLLNDMAQRYVSERTLPDGEWIEGLIEGNLKPFLHSVTREAPVGYALALYGEEVKFRQLVLPDVNGLLPWEAGAQDEFKQPILFDPPRQLPPDRFNR